MRESTRCPVCGISEGFDTVSYAKNPNISQEKLGLFSDAHVHQCLGCKSGHISPMPEEADLRDFYEQLFSEEKVVAKLRRSFSAIYPRAASQFISVFAEIDLAGKSIAEIGSNTYGWSALARLFACKEYSYFDAYESLATRKIGGVYLGWFNKKSVARIGAAEFDLIIASHSVEHLSPKMLAVYFQEIHRVLRPETGQLFIEIPLEVEQPDRQLMPPHTLFFTETSLRHFLEGQGFEIEKIEISRASNRRHIRRVRSPLTRIASKLQRILMALLPRIFAPQIALLSSENYPLPNFYFMRVLARARGGKGNRGSQVLQQ